MPTTRTNLSAGVWTDLGTTPCYMQNPSIETVFYVIDTSAPVVVSDISTVAAHQLKSDGDDLADVNVTLTGQRVYARGNGPVIVSR